MEAMPLPDPEVKKRKSFVGRWCAKSDECSFWM